MLHTPTKTWLRIGLCWLLVACSPLVSFALTQDELDANRSLWISADADDYNYFLQLECFCDPAATRPGVVEVRSGAITNVTDAETGQQLDPKFYRTVDGLFDVLQDALDASAIDIQAEFDATLGVPFDISIDFSEVFADDELAYTDDQLFIVLDPGSGVDGDGRAILGPRFVSSACESLAESRILGDADGDSEVTYTDFLILADNFGTNAGYEGGDFDCNGEVAFLDFLSLANNFGATAAGGAVASVPEPSGFALFCVAGLLVRAARRRRR